MKKEYNFSVVNARRSVNAVKKSLRESLVVAIPDVLKPKAVVHDTAVRALPTES